LQRNDPKALSNEELASLCTTSVITTSVITTSVIKTASGTSGCPLVFGNAVVPGAALLEGTLLFVCYAVSRWKRSIAKSWTTGERGTPPTIQRGSRGSSPLARRRLGFVI
jgi:hypothetical protein